METSDADHLESLAQQFADIKRRRKYEERVREAAAKPCRCDEMPVSVACARCGDVRRAVLNVGSR